MRDHGAYFSLKGLSRIAIPAILCFEKIVLAIAMLSTELPPFKNEKHNSERVSPIDRSSTPLMTKEMKA